MVLESFGPPHGRTNPYLVQLVDAFPASVRPVYFSWPRALVGRFDVFHVHWPEVLLRGRAPAKGWLRCVLYMLVLIRIRLQRRALVRTLHNLAPHEPLPALASAVLRLSDRWTTLWITLSDLPPPPSAAPAVVAPHGHYRDWFAGLPRTDSIPGRILHFGIIRPYKGISELLSAFSALDGEDVTLHIVGQILDGDTARTIERACREDGRISVIDDYVPDEKLAREVSECELVVLPFVRVTNSGSLILALSFDRPVLVPETDITKQLAAEVGPAWVQTYRDGLDAAGLAHAFAVARAHRYTTRPELTRRDWPAIGQQHALAFDQARRRARRRRREGP